MNKRAFGIVAVAALAVAALAAPVAAAPAVVLQDCPAASCDFLFWTSDGGLVTYDVTKYHDVIRGDGSETETFKGTVPFDTDSAIVYSAGSGFPIPPAQTCGSFASGRTTPAWHMTISASGNFSLVCHFPALP